MILRIARKDRYICSDPYIVSYRDQQYYFKSLISLLHVQRMTGCSDHTVRSNKYIIAESNLRTIQNGQVMIGIKLVTSSLYP